MLVLLALAHGACRAPSEAPSPGSRASEPAKPPSPRPSPAVASATPAGAPARKMADPPAGAAPRVATTVPAIAAPYDLSADLEARREEARRELGPKTPSAVVGEVFLLLGAPGWEGSAFEQSVALVRRALEAYFTGRFRSRPESAISVYLFASAAPYEKYCAAKWGEKCLSKYGFYRPDERRMVMNAGLGLGTLTHELVHPIVETDFPGAPTWINEGIASLFEAPILPRAGEIHGAKNWRHPRLLSAFASRRERDAAGLETLFGMTDERFRDEDEDLHYAMARYACQWLDERGRLWDFYRAWRDGVVNDPTGAKAFERVVGKAPADASGDWIRWVKGL